MRFMTADEPALRILILILLEIQPQTPQTGMVPLDGPRFHVQLKEK